MTALAMDDYLDSPMESEDIFPCKGCGEILEEGKAFELGRLLFYAVTVALPSSHCLQW